MHVSAEASSRCYVEEGKMAFRELIGVAIDPIRPSRCNYRRRLIGMEEIAVAVVDMCGNGAIQG